MDFPDELFLAFRKSSGSIWISGKESVAQRRVRIEEARLARATVVLRSSASLLEELRAYAAKDYEEQLMLPFIALPEVADEPRKLLRRRKCGEHGQDTT